MRRGFRAYAGDRIYSTQNRGSMDGTKSLVGRRDGVVGADVSVGGDGV